MLPDFDLEETEAYNLLRRVQAKYAKRSSGDQRDRFRRWYWLMHYDADVQYPVGARNQIRDIWNSHRAAGVVPRSSKHYQLARRWVNRRVRQRVKIALRHGEEFDPQQFEQNMPWVD